MVSVNDVYIEHGVIHIVRVSPYQKFKALQHGARPCRPVRCDACDGTNGVWVAVAVCCAGHPIILNARTEPYVFNDATFRKAGATVEDSFVSVTDKYVACTGDCDGCCSSATPGPVMQVH